MSDLVKFYGGPLHRQENYVEEGCLRVDAMDRRFESRRLDFYMDLSRPPVYEPISKASYEINWWQERRGIMGRRMRVAIIEGKGNLLDREEYEIERDIRGVPWQPVKQPSILHNFETWFNVTAYKHTLNENYIREELYPCR